uniref:Peroxisomal multifunctional enzyme type 2-like N-terminal domain-containing protein n=1 Tax=Oryza meridionalis TaxID=40149 RepID=A0A0E0CJY1_9ORYZ
MEKLSVAANYLLDHLSVSLPLPRHLSTSHTVPRRRRRHADERGRQTMAARSGPPAAAVDPEAVLSHSFPEVSFAYDERDVALYALGVGACGADAVDEKELHLVYHRDGQPHIKALPTFASLFPFKNSNGLGIVDVPGLKAPTSSRGAGFHWS